MIIKEAFPDCPICGSQNWKQKYKGPVRVGDGKKFIESEVGNCNNCGVDRLKETDCFQSSGYSSEHYREELGQTIDPKEHNKKSDPSIQFLLDYLANMNIRDKLIADVGCAGGALLDHLVGLASSIIAIEPGNFWSKSLLDRGYKWFSSVSDAKVNYKKKVDIVISSQVIEHVDNPKKFLMEIGGLLNKNGCVIISTPNRNDILMNVANDSFPSFFYRVHHRWMFDEESLTRCANEAGFEVSEFRHIHRYDFNNMINWIKSGKPDRNINFICPNNRINLYWKQWLEENKMSDNLLVKLILK